MCGIYVLFVASMHRLLAWGFICHPRLCTLFTTLYYSMAVACLVAGARARTALRRGLPLGALLLVRFAALATRVVLKSGARSSVGYYALMEVRARLRD